jgi:hypothetical protein
MTQFDARPAWTSSSCATCRADCVPVRRDRITLEPERNVPATALSVYVAVGRVFVPGRRVLASHLRDLARSSQPGIRRNICPPTPRQSTMSAASRSPECPPMFNTDAASARRKETTIADFAHLSSCCRQDATRPASGIGSTGRTSAICGRSARMRIAEIRSATTGTKPMFVGLADPSRCVALGRGRIARMDERPPTGSVDPDHMLLVCVGEHHRGST